jgi:transposase
MEFFVQLKERYSLKPIFLVPDNTRYQHCNVVMKKAEESGITLVFLPPYSPHLNIIERLWKFTKKQILYAKYYDSPDRFHRAVKGFFDTINENCYNNLFNLLSLNFQLFEHDYISQNYTA